MTDTKTCTYQKCRDVFEKPQGMPAGTWAQVSRCPKCRDKANNQRRLNRLQPPDPHLGRYEVKNEILDRFLYGQ